MLEEYISDFREAFYDESVEKQRQIMKLLLMKGSLESYLSDRYKRSERYFLPILLALRSRQARRS